jgi:hypothetical protein
MASHRWFERAVPRETALCGGGGSWNPSIPGYEPTDLFHVKRRFLERWVSKSRDIDNWFKTELGRVIIRNGADENFCFT